MDREVITLRDLLREIGIAALQTAALVTGLLAVAAFTFAVPTLIGLALKDLH